MASRTRLASRSAAFVLILTTGTQGALVLGQGRGGCEGALGTLGLNLGARRGE